MKIGIIIAMDIEYLKMQDLLGGHQGRINGNDIVLRQCGIGKVNAAIGVMRLVQEYHPDCIVSTGLAGGIDDSLQVMDVVIGSQTAYHDVWCGIGNERGQVQGFPTRFEADKNLLKCALVVGEKTSLRTHTGLICTGDQFITERNTLKAIKQQFPDALACEMESAAIAQTCYAINIPFLGIRIISDTPGNTHNHQQQWSEFLASMSDKSFCFIQQFLQNF